MYLVLNLSMANCDFHFKTHYAIHAEKHIQFPAFLNIIKKVENSPILSISFFHKNG